MNKNSITKIPTYSASYSARNIDEHFNEIIAKTTKLIPVGEGGIISIRKEAGLSRHALPIMIKDDNPRNTFDKNLFLLDAFGYKDHEVDFLYIATVLTSIWEDETMNENFSSVNRTASLLYCRWVAGTFIRNFGLTHDDADNVRIVVGLYWYLQGLTFNEDDYRNDALLSLLAKVSQSTGVPAPDIRKLLDKYELLEDEMVISQQWLMNSLTKVSDIMRY